MFHQFASDVLVGHPRSIHVDDVIAHLEDPVGQAGSIHLGDEHSIGDVSNRQTQLGPFGIVQAHQLNKS